MIIWCETQHDLELTKNLLKDTPHEYDIEVGDDGHMEIEIEVDHLSKARREKLIDAIDNTAEVEIRE